MASEASQRSTLKPNLYPQLSLVDVLPKVRVANELRSRAHGEQALESGYLVFGHVASGRPVPAFVASRLLECLCSF